MKAQPWPCFDIMFLGHSNIQTFSNTANLHELLTATHQRSNIYCEGTLYSKIMYEIALIAVKLNLDKFSVIPTCIAILIAYSNSRST